MDRYGLGFVLDAGMGGRVEVVRIRICRIMRIYRIGTMLRIVFTLTFDSSPIKGEGDMSVMLACCCPAHPATLRFPAYAGMTVGFAKGSSRERGRDATHPAVDTALKPV